MEIPKDTFSEAMLGQMRYYKMSDEKRKQYLIQQLQNEVGKWHNKVIPSIVRGDGLAGMIQQEMSLYPREWTRSQRRSVGLQPKPKGVDPVAELSKLIEARNKQPKDPLDLKDRFGSLPNLNKTNR